MTLLLPVTQQECTDEYRCIAAPFGPSRRVHGASRGLLRRRLCNLDTKTNQNHLLIIKFLKRKPRDDYLHLLNKTIQSDKGTRPADASTAVDNNRFMIG